MGKVKVQITIDERLLSRIDEYAKKYGLSRSGVISMACSLYLQDDYSSFLRELVSRIKSMDCR